MERLIRTAELCSLLGVSRITVWSWRRKKLFPAPVKFGPNSIGWPASVVEAWIASRPAATVQAEEGGAA